jgi:hypothetical protein
VLTCGPTHKGVPGVHVRAGPLPARQFSDNDGPDMGATGVGFFHSLAGLTIWVHFDASEHAKPGIAWAGLFTYP